MKQRVAIAATLTMIGVLLTVTTSAAPHGPGAGREHPRNVAWEHLDGDVWAWEKDVTGRGLGCVVEALRVHGQHYDVTRSGPVFTATVPLRSGENKVEALCQGHGGLVPVDEVRYHVPLPERPTARIDLTVDGVDVCLNGTSSTPGSSGAALVEWSWSERPHNPAPLNLDSRCADAGQTGAPTSVRVTAPEVDGEYYVTLLVTDENGHADQATGYFEVDGGRPRIPDHDTEAPAWLQDAIVYGVLPPKFGRPALQAATARLDYLQELGVNTLWLAPVNTTIPHHAGYEVVDYFGIREDYGSEEDFGELVEQAHARGMRVLMDFVPNHTSDVHRYYQDAEAHGRESVYWDLYDRKADGDATHYFGWTHLPNLNFDNPDVRRFMTEAMSYWVREYGIDGYRVDVAWGIRQRRPEFWPELRRELKRIKPDVVLIAEASARDPYYMAHGFDAAYDWTDSLGEWAWQHVWAPADRLVDRLDAALTNDGKGYPEGTLIFRFINNNDTDTRFLAQHGAGMTRVAAAMLLTLDGIPGPYTGDEIGADFHPYYDITPLDWDDDPGDLRPYYRKLLALRSELTALRTGLRERVEVAPDDRLYAYLRWDGESEPVLVVLNFHADPFQAELNLPEQFPATDSVEDRLHGDRFPVEDGVLQVEMPPFSARILTP
jgi:cyclomaltodextrinase / maltogenic alpha-amylase / neopullulanase